MARAVLCVLLVVALAGLALSLLALRAEQERLRFQKELNEIREDNGRRR